MLVFFVFFFPTTECHAPLLVYGLCAFLPLFSPLQAFLDGKLYLQTLTLTHKEKSKPKHPNSHFHNQDND